MKINEYLHIRNFAAKSVNQITIQIEKEIQWYALQVGTITVIGADFLDFGTSWRSSEATEIINNSTGKL